MDLLLHARRDSYNEICGRLRDISDCSNDFQLKTKRGFGSARENSGFK